MRTSFLKKFIIHSFFSLAFVAVIFVFGGIDVLAQSPAQPADLGLQFAQDSGLSTTDIRVTIARIIRVAMGLLGIIAVGLIMYGGFLWMTANGDQGKVESAKKVLINASIGLAIILSAFAIVSFVLNSLQSATNGGTGSSSGSGSGGGGIGGGAGGGSSSFLVTSIMPTGSLTIRNVQVKVYFNKSVDNATVTKDSIKILDDNGNAVPGTYIKNGTEVLFNPTSACPAPNSSLKCFDANKKYKVEISTSTPVKTASGQAISCALGSVCTANFTTGSLVDVQKPTINVFDPTDGSSVSVGARVKLQAQAGDDSGVASVNFLVDNSTTNVSPTFDAPKVLTKSYTAQSIWDTTGLPLKSTHKIKAVAKDIDSNTTTSSEIEVTVRAAHCFNKKQDQDETGIDCGGTNCGACTGGQCTQNSQCQSGVCSNGKCVVWPVITGFNPDTSAPETFVTITGKGFGKYIAGGGPGTSQVNFLQGSNSTPGVIPQQCSAAWSDTQIIVEVPKGLANGAYDIEVVSSDKCNSGPSGNCSDDTTNNRGIKKQFTVDSKETRPSLCNAKPAFGAFQSKFDLEGKALGTKGDVMVGSFKTSHTGVWVQNKIGGVLVPNLVPGSVPVHVKVGTKQSNAIDFEIRPSTNVPTITTLTPDNGNEGQYVQISGSGFGTTQGKVLFVDPQSSNQVLGDFKSFPASCAGGTWNDNQIVVKVPSGLTNTTKYDVIVETAVGKSNKSAFTKNNRAVTPGLCRIDPVQGPANTIVKLFGESFGTAQGRINFNRTQVANTINWQNQEIEARVPPMSPGNVKVQVIENNLALSNRVDFVIGSCKSNNNTCAVAGYTCCSDGTCQKSCPAVPKNSSFTWKFSTGIIPAVLPAPEVLEEQFCNSGKRQSPSPWRNWQDACPNADVSALFTLPMDTGTFKVGGTNDTIQLFECTDQQNCSQTPEKGLTITHVPAPKTGVIGFDISLPKNHTIGTDKVGLKPNTWYEVKLTGGAQGIKAANGVALEQDYVWQFKTQAKVCAVAKVGVTPSAATIDKKFSGIIVPPKTYPEGTQELLASALAQNCNILNAQGMTWNWASAKAAQVDFYTVQALQFPANKRVVKGLQETGSQSVAVSATTQKQTGESQITVDFKDPSVIDLWPNCQEACVNAAVGAQFATNLDPKTVNSNSVKLFICDTGACLKLTPVTGVTLALKDDVLHIRHPLLLQNEFYRVVLTKDIKSKSGAVLSGLNYKFASGTKVDDAYTWTFRTKNDATPCGVGNVSLNPTTATVKKIGDKQEYLAQPVSAPDSCNPLGQLLDPYAYDWSWKSSDTNRATMFGQTLVSLGSIQRGCTNNCLNSGSTWHAAVCGNNIVEPGEDCDDGNTNNKDGCSAVCLHEGISSSCGNGTVDKFEDCDDGNQAGGDGCSASCLNEGSANTCGNGVNRRGKTEPGEDCDDGNLVNGDGCSNICLNEGSDSKLTISVCGDGVVDPGEDCDAGGICDGGLRDGLACGQNQGCPGDPTKTPPVAPGICKPQKVVNGCSTRCTLVGNTGATCGDGTLDKSKGEQCDDNNRVDGDGCSSTCLLEGSSHLTNSLCGNGKDETGEVKACELSLPAKANGGPYNWALAKDFIADSQGATQSTAQIEATARESQLTNRPANASLVQAVTGTADFILQCGYTEDRECGNSALRGRAQNTCCYDRPKVDITTSNPLYPADDPTGKVGVCTNTAIQVPFNMPIEETSLVGNLILAEGTTQTTCPTGQNPINGLTGPGSIKTWCTGGVTITGATDTSGKIVQLQLNDFLKDNTFYRVIIKGDSDINDAAIEGITSSTGIGYNGPTKVKLNTKDHQVYSWVFKTASRCLLSQVIIENSDKDPEPFSFREFNKAKNYRSIAQDQRGQLIQPIPNIYAWAWNWSVAPTDIFQGTLKQSKVQDSIAVEAINKNGRGTLTAEARIDDSKVAGTLRACSSNDQCNSGVCLAQNNQPCSGSLCGSIAQPAGHCRVSIVGQVALEAFICNNPWPAPAQFNSTSFNDATYNFKVRYCRDAGDDKVCRGPKDNGRSCNSDSDCDTQSKCVLQIDDDLPTAQIPVKRNIGGKICVGGTNANNPCTANSQCTGGGQCKDTDLLAEYLFVLQKEQKVCHDAGRNSSNIICSSDEDCKKQVTANPQGGANSGYVYCYADAGQKLVSTSDAVGMRVMKNTKHLSPLMWYQEKISAKDTPANLARVDGTATCIGGTKVGNECSSDSDCGGGQCVQNGYRAVQEGRTVYVNAVNAQNNLAKSFYTNIYLMSYNQNANSQTQDVFGQMLASWQFNTNITNPESKKRAQRDTIRLEDLNFIRDRVEKYRAVHGTYPNLLAGSYIKGESYSVWPSWNQAFSSLIGTQVPVDPINRFKQCGSAYSERTCWDANNLKFDTATLLKTDNSLDTGSYVYQYFTQDNGKTYKLNANSEFLGLQSVAQGGTAFQCYDDAANKWVKDGAYHSTRRLLSCVLGTWRNTCGNGKIDVAAGEQCDGNNVNFCEANVGVCKNAGFFNNSQCYTDADCVVQSGTCQRGFIGSVQWHNETVQVCNSSCELTPSTTSLRQANNGAGISCGGFCGDGVLNGNEKCDINNVAVTTTCAQEGWGNQGKVGCNLNSCGLYGGGCINGPLSPGDVRVRVEWARANSSINSNIDLDTHLLVPFKNIDVASYGGTTTGDISKDEYAWVTKDDSTGSQGPDIDNDGRPDGMEMVTYRKIPGTKKYHSGTYRLVVQSYSSDACFTTNCKDIRVIVTQMSDAGQISQKIYTFPGAQLAKGKPYWHVFDMDENGNFTEIKQNNLLTSLPPHK